MRGDGKASGGRIRRDKAFRKALSNSFEGICLFHQPQRFRIAEDHISSGILHSAETAPAQLCLENAATNQTLNIAHLTAHNTAVACRLR